ncbi:hypothetical protein [Pseudomonas sp. MYb118]|uniref:hypothetical protein n=1 Tax=Pseudomonas sp. MYb118 TaxID=1848720 RepID=UPI0034CEF932
MKHPTCRSELVSGRRSDDGGVSVSKLFGWAIAIASKLAPTGILAALLLLSACTSRAPMPELAPNLPLPQQLHIQRQEDGQRQDWVLVIAREGQGIRWSMMDLLGIPQARQKLIDGRWQADGLLPPNPEARELFAALVFALTPGDELPANYPDAWQHGAQRSLPEYWDVRYTQPLNFELKLPKGPTYQVTPLTGETP